MDLQDYEKKHQDALRPGLAECAVLLRTDGSFPLEAPGRIALFGSGARGTVFGGTGSGEVNARHCVSVEEGLKKAGFTVTTGAWLDAFDEVRVNAKKAFIREIKQRARRNHRHAALEGMGAVMPQPEYELPLDAEGEAAVYVLSRVSGEGNDRAEEGDILLSASEIRDILALEKRFRRFLLVLNVGGVVDLSPVTQVRNILLLSQLGAQTGDALADLLLGRTYPSGHLTTTWAAAGDYPGMGDFGGMDDTRYREGIYVGYRYFDSAGKKPLFPFGFGLGYTTFDLGNIRASVSGSRVTVTAEARNTGRFPGKETVQVYVSSSAGRLDKPVKALAGFAKTDEAAPGQTLGAEVSFALEDFASYDSASGVFCLEKGDYVVRVGRNAEDTVPVLRLRLPEEVTVSRHRKLFGETDFEDWTPEAPLMEKAQKDVPEDTPAVTLDPACFSCREYDYDPPREIDDAARGMTDEELALLNVGAFDPKAGPLSVIGNASTTVPGAAGETAHAAADRGIPVAVMADGPAGLRLLKDYAVEGGRLIPMGSALPETVTDFLPGILVRIMEAARRKPGKNAEIRHQYATFLPVGTAVAQSWNTGYARVLGDIVGDEMERFDVDLWLAPALNIHRNIRCGRNFEYYSEDPLLSGLMAAAVTEGVQAHKGRGVTIKHFCANNQETNRFNSNSAVSERALREIYLRGFEICVREACPAAVMSSYNLLNGVHTSERRDLLTDALRCEFGFDGIVMTDWIVSSMDNKASLHRGPVARRIAAAGGELVMPGSKKDYRDILAALKSGELPREQLEVNVTRLLRTLRALKGY